MAGKKLDNQLLRYHNLQYFSPHSKFHKFFSQIYIFFLFFLKKPFRILFLRTL